MKRKFFFITILSSLLAVCLSYAQASVVQAMGEAMEDYYYEVKKLKKHPTGNKLREIHKKSHKKAKEVWEREMSEKMSLFQKEADKEVTDMVRSYGLTNEQIKRAATEQGETLDDFSLDTSASSPTISIPSPSYSGRAATKRDSTTGETSGEEGAKRVDFGVKKK